MNFEEYIKANNLFVDKTKFDKVDEQTNPIKSDSFEDNVFEVAELDSVRINKILSQNAEGDSIMNQVNTEPSAQEADSEEGMSLLEKTLNAFFSFGKIREKADKDGDGEITEDEAKDYLKEVAARDGNADDLTLDDIDAELDEAGIDLSEVIQESVEAEEETMPVITEAPKTTQPRPVKTNRAYGRSGSSYVEPNPLYSMNLEQLEAEKEVRINTLKEKQQAVNDIHSGKNEKVNSAQKELDNSRAEYEKAIENDPQMKSYRKEIVKYLEEEKKLSLEASENAIAINNITTDISKNENSILDLEAGLKSAESKLSSLAKPTGKEEDKANDAKLKEQRTQLEKSIKDSKKQLDEEKSNLKKLNKNLEKLNKEKEEIQKNIELNKEALAKSEELVKNYASEQTKAKMEAYNKAKENLETVKSAELKAATTSLEEAQNAVTEVEATITAVKYRDSNSIVEKAIAKAYEELKKGVHEETGHNDGADIRKYTRGHHYAWCAAFASYCYGDGQGRSNADTFGYDPGVRTIKAKAMKAGYYTNDPNYTPQRGDLIIYGQGSHTGIVVEVNPDGSYKTIEGNTSDAVRMKSHKAHSANTSFVRMNDWLERS